MCPVGGGDGIEGERSDKVHAVPVDWMRPQLPLLQQQPGGSVRVQPPEFLEVPLRR